MLFDSLQPLKVRFEKMLRDVRRSRMGTLVAVALVLALANILLLRVPAYQRSSTSVKTVQGSPVAAKPQLLARADVHDVAIYKGEELELNLIITQTGTDCREALNGGFCLRYSGVSDEEPFLAGYGVVPASAVHITPATVTLDVDTGKLATFVQVIGGGVHVVMTWNTAASPANSDALRSATAQGAIGPYTVLARDVVASLLFH